MSVSTDADTHSRTASFIDDDRPILLAQLREATRTPSPAIDILTDSALVRAITRPSTPRRNSGKHAHRSRAESLELPLLNLVLNEEGRQSMQLKTLLNSTTDRLEYEMRRADAVQRRAEYAETLVKQANERIASMTASRHQMELTLTQVTEELKRYKQQLEKTEMEVHQAQLSIDDLEYEKKSIEREARQAKEVARQFEKALSESDARERSRQESQKSAAERYVDGVIEGRMEGWKTAKKMERENRKKIYTAGFEAGRMEGFEAGNSRGRAYERRNAMEPFDKFLDSEGYSDERSNSASTVSQRD